MLLLALCTLDGVGAKGATTKTKNLERNYSFCMLVVLSKMQSFFDNDLLRVDASHIGSCFRIGTSL